MSVLPLPLVLERLSVSLEDLRQVWNGGGLLELDWLHSFSDESKQCFASIGREPHRDGGMGFYLSGTYFCDDPETDQSVLAFMRVVEERGVVEVTHGFADFCFLVAQIKADPASYETGQPISGALVRLEKARTDGPCAEF